MPVKVKVVASRTLAVDVRVVRPSWRNYLSY